MAVQVGNHTHSGIETDNLILYFMLQYGHEKKIIR